MRPDYKCVIGITESTCGLVGHPAEGYLLEVFHEEDGKKWMKVVGPQQLWS
jgi:hypothetical protein